MMPAVDYRIYQRDDQGFAEIYLAGKIPERFQEEVNVFTRVVREEDNLMVIPWTQGAVSGKEWSITLKAPQGGLYRIETCASPVANGMNAIEWQQRIQNICHVGVGELFMLTGQSNMAGYGRDMAYDPPQLGVHLYGNNGKWSIATHPLNDSTDTIYPENTEYPSGTSPMLAFARQIQKALNVPVGLVQASLGGSGLWQWDLEEDGTLTRGMLRRLDAVDKVGAVVWYQGCSDVGPDRAGTYLMRFERTVRQWRERLGDVPVLTVHLNRWLGTEEMLGGWGLVREAQRQAARTIPGVYVVPATDLPISDGIHNSSGGNVMLGERMASVYLNKRYGLPGLTVPDIERAELTDDTHIRVQLTEGSDVLPLGESGEGFDAEDDAGLVACRKLSGEKDALILELERPVNGNVRLHMFWRTTPPAHAPRSRHGMPMLSCYGVPVEKGC